MSNEMNFEKIYKAMEQEIFKGGKFGETYEQTDRLHDAFRRLLETGNEKGITKAYVKSILYRNNYSTKENKNTALFEQLPGNNGNGENNNTNNVKEGFFSDFRFLSRKELLEKLETKLNAFNTGKSNLRLYDFTFSYFFEEKSLNEIGVDLNLTERTMKRRLKMIKTLLREDTELKGLLEDIAAFDGNPMERVTNQYQHVGGIKNPKLYRFVSDNGIKYEWKRDSETGKLKKGKEIIPDVIRIKLEDYTPQDALPKYRKVTITAPVTRRATKAKKSDSRYDKLTFSIHCYRD